MSTPLIVLASINGSPFQIIHENGIPVERNSIEECFKLREQITRANLLVTEKQVKIRIFREVNPDEYKDRLDELS